VDTSPKLREARGAIRPRAAFLAEDRYTAPEMEAVTQLVLSGWFRSLIQV
jgi:histidine ammonia-lyase